MKEAYTASDHAEEIRAILGMNGMDCGEEKARVLSAFENELLTVNQTMNLTAITDPQQVALKHFADSLSVSSLLAEGARAIDIGSGAGFPAIPLAICRPDLRLTAVDGTEKRVAFLRSCAAHLPLPNLGAVAGRAELLSKEKMHREQYDAALARAVARLNVLCELCLPFVRVGGVFLAMKSVLAEEELAEAASAIRLLGGRLADVKTFSLRSPSEEITRTVAVIEKVTATPGMYPRAYAMISKKPL